MLHTIENEKLKVTVDERGAQLMSVYGKEDGCEYLWQGDKTYWGDRAILLFPVCGRLFGGKYTYRGKDYEMSIHGFIRAQHLAVTSLTDTSVTFTLSAHDETVEHYPFKFMYQITYSLDGAAIEFNEDFPVRESTFKVEAGGVAVICAEPDDGWYFVKWTMNGEDFTYMLAEQIPTDSDAEFVAIFNEVISDGGEGAE